MKDFFLVLTAITIFMLLGMLMFQERRSDTDWKNYLAKEEIAYYAVDAKTGETKMFFFNTNIIVDRKGALSKKVEK